MGVGSVLTWISALLLGAHFFRAGDLPTLGISVAFPALLFLRRPWAVRLVQAALLGAAGVWVHTAIEIARLRMVQGAPWARMAGILAAVALLTLLASAALQHHPSIRRSPESATHSNDRSSSDDIS